MPLIAPAPANALNSVDSEDIGELDQFHAEPQVGLVDTETIHRIEPCDPLDRVGSHPGNRLRCGEHRFTDRFEHIVLVDETHLHVELHELVLAVGT